MHRFLHRFSRNQAGATIIEFALVAAAFFMLLLGIIEFGLFMFHKLTIESITIQAARQAALGRSESDACSTASDRVAYIRCVVMNKSNHLIRGEEVSVQANPLADTNATGGTGTFVPDICLDNPKNPSGRPLPCNFYQDLNHNDRYDSESASLNAGTSGQLVEVRVSYPWHLAIPMLKGVIGDVITGPDGRPVRTGTIMITSSTIVKNEPF